MTTKSQTDVVVEGRALISHGPASTQRWVEIAKPIVTRLCDEVERLRSLSNEGYQKLGSANKHIDSILSLIEAKAKMYRAGIGPELSDECKRELKWQAIACDELAKLIGELK